MIRTLITVAIAGVAGFAGWIGGSIYPAPPQWTDSINAGANDLRARVSLERVNIGDLQKLIPGSKLDQLRAEAAQQGSQAAIAAGQAIEVETNSGTLEEQLDNLGLSEAEALGPVAAAPAQTLPNAPAAGVPQPAAGGLSLCPRMAVANAPAADAKGLLTGYKPAVQVNGVRLASYPAPRACLSSGFGARGGRTHKGVDYHSETGGPIVAAGDGTIIEIKYRDDYGNMILIDHGGGVYTRYAHLASFGRGLTAGVTVKAGEQIGLMGNTAAYPVPIHLHYEVLTGDYKNPKASFGLQAVDVFMMQPAPT